MENWNQVQTAVTIDGKDCKYTSVTLRQLFNGHHSFDVNILCPPLKGQSIWYHERESVIAMQGKTVVIRMKHENNEDETIFKGIITSIGMDGEEGVSGTIHYRGCSSTILLESGKTMDSFVDYTLQEIVDEVAEKYGNGIQIVNNPLLKDKIPYIQMHEESGYEFLRRLAYQYGEWFYYNGRELIFGNPHKEKNETIIYDVDTDMLQFGSQILPFQYSRHDYMAGYNEELYGDDEEEVSGINTHIANAVKASEDIYKSRTTLYNHAMPGHPMHIDHFLEVEKGRDTASLTWLSGESKTCRIRIGEPVAVKIPACMCERRDLGRYRITEVTHTIDSLGVYRNTFKGIPASMEYIPVDNIILPTARPVLATVMENADPDNIGRVQVQFIWQKNKDKTTNWIRVRSLDAGISGNVAQNRGFVFIPEKGDQVLVDFELGDPARPFVAGSMFHSKNGKGGNTDNHIKSIITRSGHTLEFDDDESGEWGITIKDRNDCVFHFNTKDKEIRISAPQKITMESTDIVISANNQVQIIAEAVTVNGRENIISTTQNMQNNIENKYELHAKEITEVAEKTDIQSTKENLTLNSGKEVINKSKSKKIRLS